MTEVKAELPARLPTQLFHEGHYWSKYHFVVPGGHSFEAVSSPGYWQHVAAFLKRFDEIAVIADDFSFEARFRVMSAGKGKLALRVMSYTGDPLTDEPVKPAGRENDKYEVGFAPAHKWRVIDKATRGVVAKGFDTADAAMDAANNLLEAQAA